MSLSRSVLLLQIELFVLVKEVFWNVGLGVFFQRLHQVEEACPLHIRRCDTWVSTSVNNANCIRVGLRTLSHEILEVWVLNSMATDHSVEIPSYDKERSNAFKLYIAKGNGHDLEVS